MKKKILLFILLFIPFMINAEEKCNIISGNGHDIGSEIECAGEHFYIVENKEDSVRMLSKYNLDIGREYNKVTVSAERYAELQTLCSSFYNCEALWNEPEFQGYYEMYNVNSETYTFKIYNTIESDDIKQSPKAIAAHGDEKGNPEFPEYGVVWIDPADTENTIGESYGEGYFKDFDILGATFYNNTKLDDYKNYLISNGIGINGIDIISVISLNKIVNDITGKSLPLGEWGNKENWTLVDTDWHDFYIVGNIADFLPEKKYEWLYSTTYWTKSIRTLPEGDTFNAAIFFVDALGNLCNADACYGVIGAGIRPVVEISKNSINYSLTTKTDSNGVLETEKSHVLGDTIVLNATPKKGYKLEKLIVKTESGTTIEVSGEDIIENEDGTISINPDVFTMPLENVVVEAKWQIINPKTGVVSYTLGIILILMTSIGLYLVIDRKEAYTLE